MVEKSFEFADEVVSKSLRHDAIKAFDDAAQFTSDDSLARADALSMKGGTLMLSKDYAGAAAACQLAVDLNPQHGRARFNLGAALVAQDRDGEAAAAFQAAAEVAERASTGAYAKMAADSAADEEAELQRHVRWFEGENGTVHDAVSGQPYSIDELCVHLTVKEEAVTETKEEAHSSDTPSSGGSDSDNAWDDAAKWEAGLLPSSVSLRCVSCARAFFSQFTRPPL
jgi:tetratricopeptide (TPR) repeat protein